MKDKEKILSEYIDHLNAEKRPKEHGGEIDSPELEELLDTVKMVKSLKEPSMPVSDYPKQMTEKVAAAMTKRKDTKKSKRSWYVGLSTVAAAVVMILIFNLVLSRNNIVYAMEQAFQGIKAYHGVLEVVETNADGKEMMQAKREVWANKDGIYYVEELEGVQKGLVTANNGKQKWQIRLDAKQALIFPAFPDPYRFTFELGKEIENVKNALSTKVVGKEQVAGRAAVVLEVTPKGGMTYKLWIDDETKLPLKKQGAMQNALQYTLRYTSIEFIDEIPTEKIAYRLPAGFAEINIKTEQLVNSLQEAEAIAGYEVKSPEAIPDGYVLDSITVESSKKVVILNYYNKNKNARMVVLQNKEMGELKPAVGAILGKIGDDMAEIQSPVEADSGILTTGGVYAGMTGITSVRWHKEGFEYAVLGEAGMQDLSIFVEGIAKEKLEVPAVTDDTANKPQVLVKVDFVIEENEQKSVDAGHTPWKLDPVFVAQVFVSLQISPEGIQGEYPVQYEDFKIEKNTGAEAVLRLKSDKTTIGKVYLKKLIRQDNTGIWTVVGYDNVSK